MKSANFNENIDMARTMGFNVAAHTIVPVAINSTDAILHARSIFLKYFYVILNSQYFL